MVKTLSDRAPICVVMNAGSGSHRSSADTEQGIRGVLEASGRPHEVVVIDEPSSLESRAVELAARQAREGGVLVAAGGDGTLNTLAQAALDHDCAFGVIALGTFNYFSRAQDLPLEPEKATELVLGTHIRPTQVGLLNGRIFLVNASLGLHPQLLQDREEFKQQYGRRRSMAVIAGLRTILSRRIELALQIELKGESHDLRTTTLVVNNNRLQLEQLGVPEAPAVDEGRLVAVLLPPSGKVALLGLALRGAAGQLGSAKNVERIEFRRMRVKAGRGERRKRMKVAVDGEVLVLQSPLVFEIAPRALRLVAPP